MTDLVGSVVPATFPAPVRRLTDVGSDGHRFATFCADVLGEPLWPHQEWLADHGLEKLADGRYRFGRNVVVMARQQGKTRFLAKLALWALFDRGDRLVLGVAQRLDIARVTWAAAVSLAQDSVLAERIVRVRHTSGAEMLEIDGGGVYRIAAMTPDSGRGLTVDLLMVDEAQSMRDEGVWAALLPTTAIPETTGHGQVWVAGTGPATDSVVLNTLLDSRADRTAVWWWHAPEGSDRFDMTSVAAAAPMLNRPGGPSGERVAADVAAMSEPYALREWLGLRAESEDVAIRADAWERCTESG